MQKQEDFTIDDLGNRDSVTVRDGNEKDKMGKYNRWLSLVYRCSCYRTGPGVPESPKIGRPRYGWGW